MTNLHGDFIWYELITPDPDAAEKFYSGLVNWEFKDSGQPEMDYRILFYGEAGIGGMMPLSAEMQQNGAKPLWAGYIKVDDVDAAAEAITNKGGQVIMPAQDVPNVGRISFVTDPQGAPFYIMRSSSDETSHSFSTHEPKIGHCAWNELATSDPVAAKSFYGDLFGWVKSESMDMGPMGEYEMFRNGADRDFTFGAMMQKPQEMPVSLWSYYFRVPKIDAAADYIKENGGQVFAGPMEIPGGDFIISAIDPQGAMFCLIGQK